MAERELGIDDWRNTATNAMLKEATGDWIISIEQDWFCRDWGESFNTMEQSMKDSDLFGWWNPTNSPYVHPAFFGIRKELLDKTSKDFSPHPELNGADHFAVITHDAQKLGARIDKYGGEVFPETLHFHLGGVNQNYLDFEPRFKDDALHRENIFYVYNYYSMKANVAQNTHFMERMKYVDIYLKSKLGDKIDPEVSAWKEFFK